MMGNVVVWKPANTQIYSAQVLMELFKEAGVPDGVINLVYVDGPTAGDVIFNPPRLCRHPLHRLHRRVPEHLEDHRPEHSQVQVLPPHRGRNRRQGLYPGSPLGPRQSRWPRPLRRGAFEYQGQKCSAASRVYMPSNLYEEVKGYLQEDLKSFKMGDVEDFGNFINAVISEASFDKLAKYIDGAKADPNGGNHRRRQLRQVERLLHRAHGHRGQRPQVRDHVRGAVRPRADHARLRRRQVRGNPRPGGQHLALRPHRRHVRAKTVTPSTWLRSAC